MIAFGNRASMSGAEADTWVELKRKLFNALAIAERPLIESVTGEGQDKIQATQ